MKDEAVGDDLETNLDGEDGGEEVVEVVQDLEMQNEAQSLGEKVPAYNETTVVV